MKVQLKREEIYTLTVGGRKLTNLEAHSHWEGMTKLVGPEGEILIVSGLRQGGAFGETFTAIFGDIFGLDRAGEWPDVVIHMASPSLGLELKRATGATA